MRALQDKKASIELTHITLLLNEYIFLNVPSKLTNEIILSFKKH